MYAEIASPKYTSVLTVKELTLFILFAEYLNGKHTCGMDQQVGRQAWSEMLIHIWKALKHLKSGSDTAFDSELSLIIVFNQVHDTASYSAQ